MKRRSTHQPRQNADEQATRSCSRALVRQVASPGKLGRSAPASGRATFVAACAAGSAASGNFPQGDLATSLAGTTPAAGVPGTGRKSRAVRLAARRPAGGVSEPGTLLTTDDAEDASGWRHFRRPVAASLLSSQARLRLDQRRMQQLRRWRVRFLNRHRLPRRTTAIQTEETEKGQSAISAPTHPQVRDGQASREPHAPEALCQVGASGALPQRFSCPCGSML